MANLSAAIAGQLSQIAQMQARTTGALDGSAPISGMTTGGAVIATGGTITTSGATGGRFESLSNITGVIMEAGVSDDARFVVINDGSYSFTMDNTIGNVLNGSGCVIASMTARYFVWNAELSLWCPCV